MGFRGAVEGYVEVLFRASRICLRPFQGSVQHHLVTHSEIVKPLQVENSAIKGMNHPSD